MPQARGSIYTRIPRTEQRGAGSPKGTEPKDFDFPPEPKDSDFPRNPCISCTEQSGLGAARVSPVGSGSIEGATCYILTTFS